MIGVILFELLLPLIGGVWFFFVCGGKQPEGMRYRSLSEAERLREQGQAPLLEDVVGGDREVDSTLVGSSDDQRDTVRPPLRGQMTLRQMLCTIESPLLLYVHFVRGVNLHVVCWFVSLC